MYFTGHSIWPLTTTQTGMRKLGRLNLRKKWDWESLTSAMFMGFWWRKTTASESHTSRTSFWLYKDDMIRHSMTCEFSCSSAGTWQSWFESFILSKMIEFFKITGWRRPNTYGDSSNASRTIVQVTRRRRLLCTSSSCRRSSTTCKLGSLTSSFLRIHLGILSLESTTSWSTGCTLTELHMKFHLWVINEFCFLGTNVFSVFSGEKLTCAALVCPTHYLLFSILARYELNQLRLVTTSYSSVWTYPICLGVILVF